MARYDASIDLKERKQLLEEVQAYLLDQHLLIPLCRNVLSFAAGPRLDVPKIEEIIGAIPQYTWVGPWEDVKVKD
jgi:hypothetical protein